MIPSPIVLVRDLRQRKAYLGRLMKLVRFLTVLYPARSAAPSTG